MQDIFEKLRELQVILSQKYSVQDEIKEIPKNLEKKIELVNKGKKNYLDKNEKIEKTRDEIKNLRIRLDDAERARENYEKQMDQISTQREYEALDKEIKDASDKEQQFRKTILHKENVLEELLSQIEEQEDIMKIQEEEARVEQEIMESNLREKNALLNELEMQEKLIIPGIDPEVLFKFERIIRSKSGIGIVPIHGTVCTGCHMSLPIKFVNDVRKGDSFKFCPYCSRILYYEDVEIDTDDYITSDNDSEENTLADLVDLDEFDI